MSQEQLTSAFQELQVFMEALMSDEIDESAIDWDTVDREYVFKNVLGQDIITLFESLDSEGLRKLLGGLSTELMTESSVINYISMQGYEILKEEEYSNDSISFAAREGIDYSSAIPTCCTIIFEMDGETGAGRHFI